MDSVNHNLAKQCGILLSGGLDSAYNAFKAQSSGLKVSCCFFFNYGQKACCRERESSRTISSLLDSEFLEFDIRPFFEGTGAIEYASGIDLDDETAVVKSMQASWIPNRNGLLINAAAAVLEKRKIRTLLCGFNAEEAVTFKDNSTEFLDAVNESLRFSTLNQVEVKCLSMSMHKEEIMGDFIASGFPVRVIWSCYHGGKKMCGKCESCLRFTRALKNQGKLDEYRDLFG